MDSSHRLWLRSYMQNHFGWSENSISCTISAAFIVHNIGYEKKKFHKNVFVFNGNYYV